MDYKKDTYVDPDNIDREILEHGQRYMEYAEAAAEADEEKNLAQQRTKLIRSRVAREVRRKPKKYGLDGYPPTVVEKMVKDIVETHPKVIKVDRQYYEVSKRASILASAAHAMGSYKKNSIQKYAEMVLRGFFSEPRLQLESDDYANLMRDKGRSKEMSIKQRKLTRKKRRK